MIHTPSGAWPSPGPAYLASARFIDCATEAIRAFAQQTVVGASTEIEKAVKLFYRVRDGWRYDPFIMSLDAEPYLASNVLKVEYDAKNRRHMEYLRDHGCWSDFPFDKVMADFRAFYPTEAYPRFRPGERFEDGERIE